MDRRSAVSLMVVLAAAVGGCTTGNDSGQSCVAASGQVEERVKTVVRDVAEHRMRAVVRGGAGSEPLVLQDKAVQVGPELAKSELRDYEVLSWNHRGAQFVGHETKNVVVESAQMCGTRLVAQADGVTKVVRKSGGSTESAIGTWEFRFETAGDTWTLDEHRLVGVVKQQPMIMPEQAAYDRFDRK